MCVIEFIIICLFRVCHYVMAILTCGQCVCETQDFILLQKRPHCLSFVLIFVLLCVVCLIVSTPMCLLQLCCLYDMLFVCFDVLFVLMIIITILIHAYYTHIHRYERTWYIYTYIYTSKTSIK